MNAPGTFEWLMGCGHETCANDVHNISKSDYLTFVNLSRSIDRKHLQGLESNFLLVPSFYISFFDLSKLTLGNAVQHTVMYIIKMDFILNCC